jgi:hypothetical protein
LTLLFVGAGAAAVGYGLAELINTDVKAAEEEGDTIEAVLFTAGLAFVLGQVWQLMLIVSGMKYVCVHIE